MLLLATGAAAAQDLLRWEADLATAQNAAVQTNRLVLIHFGAVWCPACVEMERNVLSRPGIGTTLSPFYVCTKVEVPPDFNHPLVKQWGVDRLPFDVVLSPQGQVVERSSGPKSAEQFVGMLNQLAQNSLMNVRQTGGVLPATNAAPLSAGAAGIPAAPRYSTVYQGPTGMTPPPATAQSPAAGTNDVRTAGAERPVATGNDRYANYYSNRGMTPPPPPPLFNGANQAAPLVSPPPTGMSNGATLVGGTDLPQTPTPPTTDHRPLTTFVPLSATQVTPPAPVQNPPVLTAPTPVAPPRAAETSPPPPAEPAPSFQAMLPVATRSLTPPAQAPAGEAASSTNESTRNPPAGLDGYCPVTVTEKMVWTKGDPKFGAVHRGRIYLFASVSEQTKFLENPDRYSPIISGNDPVTAVETATLVSGKREFGMMCEGRMILFSSKTNYDKFVADRKRYLTALQQALAAAGDTTRR